MQLFMTNSFLLNPVCFQSYLRNRVSSELNKTKIFTATFVGFKSKNIDPRKELKESKLLAI